MIGHRAALGGSYSGVEAAHVHWHAFDGDDTVTHPGPQTTDSEPLPATPLWATPQAAYDGV